MSADCTCPDPGCQWDGQEIAEECEDGVFGSQDIADALGGIGPNTPAPVTGETTDAGEGEGRCTCAETNATGATASDYRCPSCATPDADDASDDDGPECSNCGKTTCPDADLPEFSEPRECEFASMYEAFRATKDCDYGCGRDYSMQAVRLWLVPEMERVLAARTSAAATRAADDRSERIAQAIEALRRIQNLAMEHMNCSGCPTPWWLKQELSRDIPPAVPATPDAEDTSPERIFVGRLTYPHGHPAYVTNVPAASDDASEGLTEYDLTPDERGTIMSGQVDGSPVGVVAAACHVFNARVSAAATRAADDRAERIAQAIEALRRIQTLAMEHADCTGCPTPWWLTQELAKEAGHVDL